MEQCISKSTVVAEIERRIKTNKECMLGLRNLDYYQGKVDALNDTLSLIDTIEAKEVDLEKEIDNYIYSHLGRPRMALELDWKYCDIKFKPEKLTNFAKHFYELGLKAQIMTSKLQQRISVLKMDFWTGLQTFEETEMTLSDAYNQGVDDILEELGLKAQRGE